VITTRFTDAAQLYPPLKETGAELLRATEYTGCYSLQLMYDRRTEKEPFIIMLPESVSPAVCAVFLEHVKAPDRAPAGKSHFTAFFNLNSDIDFDSWSEERLTEGARTLVESLFPELDGQFLAGHLTRWAYAAHKGNVGYYRALDAFLRAHPADDPVQVAGDYMSVAGQESAVVAGVKAAQRLHQHCGTPEPRSTAMLS
jgi:protoporphyrinogen oxidase